MPSRITYPGFRIDNVIIQAELSGQLCKQGRPERNTERDFGSGEVGTSSGSHGSADTGTCPVTFYSRRTCPQLANGQHASLRGSSPTHPPQRTPSRNQNVERAPGPIHETARLGRKTTETHTAGFEHPQFGFLGPGMIHLHDE